MDLEFNFNLFLKNPHEELIDIIQLCQILSDSQNCHIVKMRTN